MKREIVSSRGQVSGAGEVEADPLLRARAEEEGRRQELLEEAGGALKAEALAKLLEITPQKIEEQRRALSLLAVLGADGEWLYPLAQFGANKRALPYLDRVLRAFKVRDPWMQLSELLAVDEDLGGRSIFQLLREEGEGALPLVLRSISGIGEHAA